MDLLSLMVHLPLIAFLASAPFSAHFARLVALFFAGLNLSLALALPFTGPAASALPPLLGYPLILTAEGPSLLFLPLSKAVALIALLTGPVSARSPRTFAACVLGADFALSGALLCADVVGFLFFWALAPVPLTLLVGIWGGGERQYAARQFFLHQGAATALLSVALAVPLVSHRLQVGFDSALPAELGGATLPPVLLWALIGACWIRGGVFPCHGWLSQTLEEAPPAARLFLCGGLVPTALVALARFTPTLYGAAWAQSQTAIACLLLVGLWYTALVAGGEQSSRALACFLSAQGAMAFLGVAVGSEAAVAGAHYHLLVQGLVVGGLFRVLPQRGWALALLVAGSFIPGAAGFPGGSRLLSSLIDHNLIWAAGTLGGWFAAEVALIHLWRKGESHGS